MDGGPGGASDRGIRRPKLRLASLLVLPAYLLVTVVSLFPILERPGSAIPSSRAVFDPPLQAFLIGWDWYALTTDPASIFNAPIFHPEHRTLTYMDHMIGETLLASPVFAVHGSLAAAYNFLLFLSFPLSAWATYRLARLFRVSRLGAFLAGLIFAFSAYRFANLDLLNQLQTQFIPLGLFFWIRYLQRHKLRDAAGTFATLVVQVFFGWYYAFYLFLALLLAFLYAWASRLTQVPRRQWAALLVTAALALVAILPVTWPYVETRTEMPSFRRTLGESALYSADVLDYTKWSASSSVARFLRLPTGPQSYWPGLAAVVLGAFGIATILRRLKGGRGWRDLMQRAGWAGFPLLLTVTGFILSLGPILHVAGRRIWLPLPYAVLYFVIPGFSSMRAPARLAVMVTLGMALLAGIGYARVLDRVRGRGRLRQSLAAIPFVVALAGAADSPRSMLELPDHSTMPPIYRWIDALPGATAILELPVPANDSDENEAHSIRQLLTLYHGKPRLDGTSGFVSPSYRTFRSLIQTFPDDSALAAIRSLGGDVVVVHYGDYAPADRARLAARVASEPRLALRARAGSDAAYLLDGASRRPAGELPQ
jgi:hypothetical protein